MARNSAENHPHSYQKHLKQKENYDEFRRTPLVHSVSLKALKPMIQQQIECKICKVLARPGDVCKVLHQGLYHKYTSSQDYFYTRDINSLLMKKRKEFCIRYYDDLIFDESKERLKGFFKRKEAKALMNEIKQFYTKFKNFPRNFHTHFYHIINSNIRKQRRLEYIRVFHNVNLDEDKAEGNESDSQRDYSKDKENFNFMEMLGSSFLQENYKDMSGVVVGDLLLERRRNTEQLIKEIDANFKALYNMPQNAINDPKTADFSNAVYNKNYMLYSRNDSETAEDMLRQIVSGFKDVDFSRRPSMTLAEQVLQKVAPATAKNTKKPENRPSPTLKQRNPNIIEPSSTVHSAKNSVTSSLNLAAGLYQLQKQQNQPLNMAKRPPSNPRTNSQADSESTTSTTLKMNQSKLSEQRKSNSKFSLENLNDLGINRDQILNNLSQFRSTRTKSGATKSSLSTSKTSSSKTRRPLTVQCNNQGTDSIDSRNMQTGYYLDNKSPSISPEKKRPREETDRNSGTIDIVSLSKAGLDSPQYNPMKRSTSNGPGLDINQLGSPTGAQSQKSAHKKSSSMVKRSSTMTKTHIAHNPSMQNLNISNTQNLSGHYLATEVPASPTIKFTNPLRATLGNSQILNLNQRHQSPVEERRGESSGKVSIGQKMRNLDIRALKASPKGMENYRMNTMSMSGRFQNLSELSQGTGSFICNQTSLQASKQNSQTIKRKKVTKAETQTFGSKITKRASATPTPTLINSNTMVDDAIDKEKKVKKSLELGDMNYKSYKDLRLQSKEQTPMNLCPSSATSLNRLKVEVKKSFGGSYTVKGSTKDLRLTLKK